MAMLDGEELGGRHVLILSADKRNTKHREKTSRPHERNSKKSFHDLTIHDFRGPFFNPPLLLSIAFSKKVGYSKLGEHGEDGENYK